jgi:hypothetical protein
MLRQPEETGNQIIISAFSKTIFATRCQRNFAFHSLDIEKKSGSFAWERVNTSSLQVCAAGTDYSSTLGKEPNGSQMDAVQFSFKAQELLEN